jgi:hypothetical protein
MGSCLVEAVEGKSRPTVGLLNIGSEEIKGNEVVKAAGELLRKSPLNFYGNIEGNDIFKGTADVVVCDGFVGNITLKASEGLAHMIGGALKQEFARNLLTKLAALAAMPVLKAFRQLRAATTAPACSASRASWSRAMARPTSSPSGTRWKRRPRRRASACRKPSRRAWPPSPRRRLFAIEDQREMIHTRVSGTGGYLPDPSATPIIER